MRRLETSVNVVFAGHVDHGKSTLLGRLLYDSESITEGRVEEIQKLAEEYKKRFEFAYFLDSFEEELKEERTIDTTSILFKGKNYYSIADVPGHKEFIKNMLTGASHADIAVLVVSASERVQEQTRRHAFLLRMLGVKHLLVLVNKMDTVNFEEQPFLIVRDEMKEILCNIHYFHVEFIPASALKGDNIYRPSERMKWYKGPTLIEALDSIKLGEEERPLRFVVQDVYQIQSERTIVGRVESGILKKGDKVIFQPSGVVGRIEKIKVFQEELKEAIKGDCVGIVIDGQVRRGDVCGWVKASPRRTERFTGEVVLLDKNLKNGEKLELKCGTRKVRCEVEKIKERIDSETAEVLERNPTKILENEAATIVFATEPLVMEKFSQIPQLGRFVLVRNDTNIGAGIVIEVPN